MKEPKSITEQFNIKPDSFANIHHDVEIIGVTLSLVFLVRVFMDPTQARALAYIGVYAANLIACEAVKLMAKHPKVSISIHA